MYLLSLIELYVWQLLVCLESSIDFLSINCTSGAFAPFFLLFPEVDLPGDGLAPVVLARQGADELGLVERGGDEEPAKLRRP